MAGGRRIIIVANPASGRGRALGKAETVAQQLRDRGHGVDVRRTTASGDATRVTLDECSSNQPLPDCVAACGGDGTMQEVAHALAQLKDSMGDDCPAMGLIPAGRCNDFARVLGVRSDVASVVDILDHGVVQSVDLGRVNGRHYCTVATVGVDADISSYVDRMRMPLRGKAAYVYGTLCVLCRYSGLAVRIEGDFGVIEKPVFVASTANTSLYGGAIPIAPKANPMDGLLDLCVIDFKSRWQSFTMLPRVLMGRHTDMPGVRFIRTKHFQIVAADGNVPIWADGERIATTPATIESVPNALGVMVSKTWQLEHLPFSPAASGATETA